MVEAIDQRGSPSGPSPRPYLIALLAAVILHLGLRLRILEHVLRAQCSASWLLLELQRGLLVLFVLLLVRLLPGWRRAASPSRRQLGFLVQLASGMAAANLLAENLTLYRLNLLSYALLMDALMLYLGISLIFYSGAGILTIHCVVLACCGRRSRPPRSARPTALCFQKKPWSALCCSRIAGSLRSSITCTSRS